MSRIYKNILLFLLALTGPHLLEAQPISRFNTFSYSVNEGLLQSTINDINFDKKNFCWISFPNGIQKFDGKNFITVPVQTGLPDDKLVFFFQCHNGDLLLSHSSGISRYDIKANRFVLIYANTSQETKPAIFIGQDDGIIYFYSSTATIVSLDAGNYKKIAAVKTNFPVYKDNLDIRPRVSENILNHRVAFQLSSHLFLWDLKQDKMLYESGDMSMDMLGGLFQLRSDKKVLYSNYGKPNAFEIYDFSNKKSEKLAIRGQDNRIISRATVYQWGGKTICSFNNKLYELDSSLKTIKAELVNFKNQPVAETSTIAHVKEDNFGNLYLQTVTDGIKKVIRNNYPIKYFGTEKREANFVISILPDKANNRLLVGTTKGVLVFDTLQQLAVAINTTPHSEQFFAPNSMLKTNRNDYLLFGTGEQYVWQMSGLLSFLEPPIPLSSSLPDEKKGINYFGTPLYQDNEQAIIQSQSNLYKVNFRNKIVTETKVTNSYTMSGLWCKKFILTHADDELIFLDTASFKELRRVPLKNTGYVRCFAINDLFQIYIGSNNGIFKVDSNGKLLSHITRINGLPDNCIYAMVFDNDGLLWCSTNKGVFRINKDNTILQLKREDGLQENEFNTNIAAKSPDGELFFGGVNGVSSFYPRAISNFEEKMDLFFTGIKANNEDVIKDTAAWSIMSVTLPYTQNSLSFDFIAMATNTPAQYIYQYRMDGVDKEWIQNEGFQTVRYSLPPGTYTFKIFASRFYDKDAVAMREITIIITPPFWKTWWFITSLALVFIGLLAFATNRYVRSGYEKKLQVLENEQKIKSERERISRDLHDSLGAYANAILYNTEMLEQEQNENKKTDLMKDLKFASKDIITSLRETVWALNKENYSADDCLLRIRNFVQPLSRYYGHINFSIEGKVPAGKQLHYTKALNLVRIIQEAVSNSIKHAAAKNIQIHSEEESDKWKLTVSDDGNGFDYEQAKELETGNGLSNMQRRSAESGFDFNIASHEQKGTRITVNVN